MTYRYERWEDPYTGEKGWLVLDLSGTQPEPVDVFPTRKLARKWILDNSGDQQKA